ncbi:MAG TPA: S8 family serine peptidase [Bacteroidales bacterium]
MKKFLSNAVLIIALVMSTTGLIAQTITNVPALTQLADEFSAEWDANQIKVQQYAAENNVPIYEVRENGRTVELVDVVDGQPVYRTTFNLGAAHTTKAFQLWEGESSGLNLSGEGYSQLGEWDGGGVLTTHQEFMNGNTSRVTKMDAATNNYHSTHVAGTMIAAGVQPLAKGMAYKANLKAWQWSNDISEMATAAASGLEISNHSYGGIRGWDYNETTNTWSWKGNTSVSPTEDYLFGFYSNDSKAVDQVAFNAPNYLIVWAAGNDRGDGPSNAGQDGNPEKDGGTDGYDCIAAEGVAKNTLTVGAIKEVWNYTDPSEVLSAYFSGWGPADDGRVKPDVVGKGLAVYSCTSPGNTAYESLQGTSMASPNVAGSLALLQSHYQALHGGTPMRAATLKGLAIHTANEAGLYDGPDYMFGWGVLNAEKAALLISDDVGQNSIDELELQGGNTYSRNITVPEGTPELKVTISWTDPAGNPVAAQLNPRNKMLVNDLDLIVKKGSTNYYPYKLDPEDPSAAATTNSKNGVDNVEVISIKNPTPGIYTVFIDHAGSLQNNKQAYSLIISGIEEYTVVPECVDHMTDPVDGGVDAFLNQWVEWYPAFYASSYDVYFGTDGGGVNTPTNVYNGENFPTNGFTHYLEPATTYYLKVVPVNNVGEASGCNTIYSFTTMASINQFPHLETMANITAPQLPQYWQSLDNSDGFWQSTKLGGHTDSKSMICVTEGFAETDFDNWVISPPFAVEEGKEYNISYYYSSFFPGHTEELTLYWGETPYIDDLNTIVFQDMEITNTSWLEGNGVIVPGYTGEMFLGFHLTSAGGIGVMLDDIMVENWGTVGIGDNLTDNTKIYYHSGQIFVKTDEIWKGADLLVMNSLGQVVYSGNCSGNETINISSSTATGLYLVNLVKDGQRLSKKIIIR